MEINLGNKLSNRDAQLSKFAQLIGSFIDRNNLGPKYLYLPTNDAFDYFLEFYNLTFDNFKSSSPNLTFFLRNHMASKEFSLFYPSYNFICFGITDGEIASIPILNRYTIDHFGLTIQVYVIDGVLMTLSYKDQLEAWLANRPVYGPRLPSSVAEAEAEGLRLIVLKARGDLRRTDDSWWSDEKLINKQVIDSELTSLYNVLRDYDDVKIRPYGDVDAEYHLDVLEMVRETLTKYRDLMQDRKLCHNKLDWVMGDAIDEVPSEEYIRLSNGACWHVGSLMDFMRANLGFNSARNLKDYPTETLFGKFNMTEDLERLLNHPMAVEENFREWYENRNLEQITSKISKRTMDELKAALELLISDGEAFDNALREDLRPEVKQALVRAKGVIANAQPYTAEIISFIDKIFKTPAVARLNIYLNNISKEEREALLNFRPDLIGILTRCEQGAACTWYTADIIRDTYNDLATVMKIPKLYPEVVEFEHVTPAVVDVRALM